MAIIRQFRRMTDEEFVAALAQWPDLKCHACRYSLKGLTSARCPECGQEVLTEIVPEHVRAASRTPPRPLTPAQRWIRWAASWVTVDSVIIVLATLGFVGMLVWMFAGRSGG
jgi:predicted RNA-binding Zn-ribbon protein involved in translation (DUF1610 family)